VPNEIVRRRRKIASISPSCLIGWSSGNRLDGVYVGRGCSRNIFTCLTVVIQVLRVWRQAVEVTISYPTDPPPTLSPPLRYMLLCVRACVRFSYRVITNIFWALSYRRFVGEFAGTVVCDADPGGRAF